MEKITNTHTSLEIYLMTRFAIEPLVLGSGGRNGLDRNNIHCFELNCHKIKLKDYKTNTQKEIYFGLDKMFGTKKL